jgi:hypothetical protein
MNKQILLVLALSGGLSILMIGIMRWFSGDKKGAIETLKVFKQNLLKDDIKKISENQTIIKKDIEEKEKLSQEAQEKIIDIQKQASVEIEEILKEERIKNTSEEIDELWEKI